MKDAIRAQLRDHTEAIALIERELTDRLAAATTMITDALNNGKKLLIMGNGGSAADAQHFAAEIVGRFKLERRGLPALALTTDTSILTAIGNDYGFDAVFSRQIEALGSPGDVVVGISTSGNSKNVLVALQQARELGCRTIAFLGRDGGAIRNVVDIDLTVTCNDTPRVQEGHITMIHIICDLVEKGMFGEPL